MGVGTQVSTPNLFRSGKLSDRAFPRAASRSTVVVLLPMFTREGLHRLWSGAVPWLPLGELEPYIARHIGARGTRHVLLSGESYHHVVHGHPDLGDDELMLMPEALTRGLVLYEKRRRNWAVFCFQHPQAEARRYALAIKAADHGHQIFARSFHRMHDRQTKAILRRGYLLRRHQ